jgi:hypothetical protein
VLLDIRRLCLSSSFGDNSSMKRFRSSEPVPRSAVLAVAAAFAALYVVLIVPKFFMIPIVTSYYAGRVGACVGLVTACTSATAFLACPRRAVPKTFCLGFLLPTLYLGINYFAAYLTYGPRP